MGSIILQTEAYIAWQDFSLFDYLVVSLASWRMTRFLVQDDMTRFIREQFLDVIKVGRGYRLEKPKTGPRRFLAETLHNHWAAGVGMATIVLFLYVLTPYAVYPLAIFAVAAVASLLDTIVQALDRRANDVFPR